MPMLIINTGWLILFQAACETFSVQGRHCIQIPKLYTSDVTWDPHHYRLVQDSQPLDLNKGGCPPAPHGLVGPS